MDQDKIKELWEELKSKFHAMEDALGFEDDEDDETEEEEDNDEDEDED